MNWHERIDRAEKRGRFSAQDRTLAGPWTTCACAEQDPRIPRQDNGQPCDSRLSRLGYAFVNTVAADNFPEARSVLNLIEKRAGEILAEMKGKGA